MPDPADKSDDLIAELAKLMAASPGGSQPAVAPIARPAPLDPSSTAAPAPSSPTPIRIPGMDQPRPANASSPVPAAAAQRAPVTGAIRIPGKDNPAPVSTSAPVSTFDFGARPAAAAPIKQEPLSTLAERLAPQNPAARSEPAFAPQPSPSPVRIPSDLKPVSESRSFATGPALNVAAPTPAPAPTPAAPPPAAPAAPAANDFSFDFGFGRNPPASPTPPRPTDEAPPAADPIGDLIAAEMGDGDSDSDSEVAPEPQKPSTVTPIVRTQVTPQSAPPKPAFSTVSTAPQQRPASAQPIPLKPVSVAPRAPETDRFAISPGVGLNMKPAVGQPLNVPTQRAPEPASRPDFPDTDPMSEIESLIGEAVRVELSPPGPVRVQAAPQAFVEVEPEFDDAADDVVAEQPQPQPQPQPKQPAPVVPPLNSQFAPRRSGLKEEPASTSAEDAILAAAAATGAQVDRIDPPTGDESPYRRLKVKPARSSWASGGIRQYVGMAVAGTLLLAAGLGLYWVLNMGRGNTLATANDAPQLTADATPVKEVPATQPTSEADTARSPVLEQMGGTTAQPSTEQLVSTDETGGEAVPRDVTQPTAEDTEGGLANRKVRTVTVRPDGTIVSGDDAVAGAEALPVERPNVPEVPSTSAEVPNLLGDTTTVAMTDPVTENTALGTTPAPLTATTATSEAAIQPVFDPTIVPPKPMNFPVRSSTPAPAASETVASFAEQEPAAVDLTGAQTPNGQIDLLGGEIEQPTQVAAAPARVDTGSAAAYVQLSSSPSEADAQASLRALNNRYGSLFGGNSLVIQSADLGQKGTWYRVKLPTASVADAQSVCADIKANGGDCIVAR
jgi:hypothetical protein